MKPYFHYSLIPMTMAIGLISTSSAVADESSLDPVRICFARGQDAVTVNGQLDRNPRTQKVVDSYFSLRVKKGQRLRIKLDRETLRGGFISPSGKERIEDGPVVFNGEVDEPGDYQIRVHGENIDGSGAFNLKIEAQPFAENCSVAESLERYVGNYPEDLWKAKPALKARLQKLLGSSSKDFFRRMETTVPIEKKNGGLVVFGCQEHMCGSEIAECALTLSNNKWHCIIVFDGEKAKVFSEDKAHLSPEIKEVMKNFPK